jgi:carbonic anhydrase
VLGHQHCGAVQAVVQGGHAPGHIPALFDALQPAVEEARTQAGDDLVEKAVRANVRLTADAICNSNLISQLTREGRVEVVGAYYSLETGRVDFL